jgi:hypothetical protein
MDESFCKYAYLPRFQLRKRVRAETVYASTTCRKSVTRDTGFGVTAALPMPDTQLGETHTVPTNPRPVSRYRAHRRLQAPRSSNHILFPGSVCL